MLMDSVLAPGQRINIEAVARDLNVSPSPVREALARLEALGLVTKQPLKGYSVAPLLASDEVVDLFEVRQLVEPTAARRAATRITGSAIAELEQTLVTMRNSSGPGEAGFALYRQFVEADAAFHQQVAQASASNPLRDCIVRLRPHLHLYRLSSHTGARDETLDEHERIIAALRSGDGDRAATEMQDHLTSSLARYLA